MEPSQTPIIPAEEERDGLISRMLKVAAYPISGVVGFLFTKQYVESKFYDNFKESVVKKERIAREAAIVEKWPSPGMVKDVTHEIDTIHKDYWVTTQRRFAEAGFSNTWKRFYKGLHFTQKFETVGAFVTATAITLGVLLTVADSKQLRSLLAKKEQEAEENGQLPLSR